VYAKVSKKADVDVHISLLTVLVLEPLAYKEDW
jgi:hypothetical protein